MTWKKMWKLLLLLISSLSKKRKKTAPRGMQQGQEEGRGREVETTLRRGATRDNSSSPTVRSHLSEEVRPFLMGGSVLIRVSSWPLSNFTHQREHHPAAGMPERGAAGIWRIFRDLLVEPRVIWTHRGEKSKSKSSMIFLILWIFDIHAAVGGMLAFAHPLSLPLLLFYLLVPASEAFTMPTNSLATWFFK